MKKIILAICVILFFLLLLLGWWGFTFDQEKIFHVHSGQNEIYNYLVDPSYYPQWYNGFERYDFLRGHYSAEGSQYLLHIREDGAPLKVIETFVDLDSPQFIHKEHQHDFYNLDIHIQLLSITDDSTHMTIRQTIYGTRFIERILLPLYAAQVMEEHYQNYASAQKVLE